MGRKWCGKKSYGTKNEKPKNANLVQNSHSLIPHFSWILDHLQSFISHFLNSRLHVMIQCIFLRFKEIWHSLCKTTLSNEANRKWKKIYIFSFLQPILIIFVSFELSGPLDFTIAEPPKSLLMFFVTKSFLSFCFCWFFPLESFLWPLPLEVEGILKSVEATGVSMKEPTQPSSGGSMYKFSTNSVYRCINFLLKTVELIMYTSREHGISRPSCMREYLR